MEYLKNYIGKKISDIHKSAIDYEKNGKENLFKARNLYQLILNQPNLEKYYKGRIYGDIWRIDKIIKLEKDIEYFSQYGQDKFIYENFFPNKKNGFFLEIGAYDGLSGSNCAFFEKYLNWKGLLIEPSPIYSKKIKKNRSMPLVTTALGSIEGKKKFLSVEEGYTQMSGLLDNISIDQMRLIRSNDKHKENIIEVPVTSLSNLLKKFHLNKIDYCSLDTEGSEEEILSVFNFKDFYIDVFSIENNNKNKYIKNIMEKNNYELLNIIGYDEIWKKLSKEKNI